MRTILHKIYFLLIVCCLYQLLPAQQVQQFQKVYGRPQIDEGLAIPTIDSGYVVIATLDYLQWNSKACLMKLNKYGDTIWTKVYSFNTGALEAVNIIQTTDTGYLFTCAVPGFSLAVKTDKYGDTLWVKPCGASKGLVQTYDGGYAHTSANHIFRRDANFNLLWIRKYGGGNLDYSIPSTLKQTPDSGFILASSTRDLVSGGPNDLDVYIVKTDKNGYMQWDKVLGTPSNREQSENIIVCTMGGYAVVGTIETCGNVCYDILVIQLDATGNVLWAKKYGNTYADDGYFIVEAKHNVGFIIGGSTQGLETSYWPGAKSYIIKTDLGGNFQWAKMYGDLTPNSPYDDQTSSIFETPDSGYVLSGRTAGLAQFGGYDIWLVKTDQYGVSGCNEMPVTPTVLNCSLVSSPGGFDTTAIVPLADTTIQIETPWVAVSTLCSNILMGTNEIEDDEGVLIYPNPFTETVTIKMEEGSWKLGEIKVYNILGERVFQSAITNPQSAIDLSSLPSGIYFVRVTTKEGIVSRKIVKE